MWYLVNGLRRNDWSCWHVPWQIDVWRLTTTTSDNNKPLYLATLLILVFFLSFLFVIPLQWTDSARQVVDVQNFLWQLQDTGPEPLPNKLTVSRRMTRGGRVSHCMSTLTSTEDDASSTFLPASDSWNHTQAHQDSHRQVNRSEWTHIMCMHEHTRVRKQKLHKQH